MFLRHLMNALCWIFMSIGISLIFLASIAGSAIFSMILFLLALVFTALGLMMLWWYLRSNRSQIAPSLHMETWDIASDRQHRSNTDMICWRDVFYLAHAVSPYHFASQRCYLTLSRSPDGRAWEELARFQIPGEDIRDPKLALINGRIVLYVLANRSFDPEPYTTLVNVSEDGIHWSGFDKIEPEGWLFWKPKSIDGSTWYVPAYWWEHGRSALFSTSDGIHMTHVAAINEGKERNDETDIAFLPDGRMIVTARIEGDFKEWTAGMFFGHRDGGTLISIAEPPYTAFTPLVHSALTRLDGPALFSHNGRVYGVGRRQPDLRSPFSLQGSIFARKRTAIFEVTETGLVWLSDVPSAGDTAYAGTVIKDGALYFAYYTSDISKDFPWIAGMLNASAIRMATVNLEKLEDLANHYNQVVTSSTDLRGRAAGASSA